MEINMMNECYQCVHCENVPGDAHIRCESPDPDMTGNPHGIRRGWFHYPYVFDPVWKTKDCANFKRKSQ
jgi:hypothetical protein